MGHIPTRQTGTKYQNTTVAMRAACEHPEISETFLFANDDMFVMERLDAMPVLHRGPVREVEAYCAARTCGQYLRGMRETRDLLVDHGFPDPLSYELHVALPVAKAGMLKAPVDDARQPRQRRGRPRHPQQLPPPVGLRAAKALMPLQTGPCEAWPTELCCDTENAEAEDIERWTLVASQILWALSGRRIGPCPVTVRPCRRACLESAGSFSFQAGVGTGPWIPYIGTDGLWRNASVRGCTRTRQRSPFLVWRPAPGAHREWRLTGAPPERTQSRTQGIQASPSKPHDQDRPWRQHASTTGPTSTTHRDQGSPEPVRE
ncbi:hypothetical protein [Streptomyces sp. NPDC050164]|uniref:hypothetical protein n=1 Tax=Streptomyces sp. NPDC050164 TaxID=3365605 RepID=UPI0037AF61AD